MDTVHTLIGTHYIDTTEMTHINVAKLKILYDCCTVVWQIIKNITVVIYAVFKNKALQIFISIHISRN
jgi:hypothetical protein